MVEPALKIRHRVVVGVVLCGAAFLSLATPLLRDHILGASDARLHAMWTHDFALALAEGVVYPRWAQTANGGLGEPAFLFLHPAFYYAASAFLGAGLSLKHAIFGVLLISNTILGLVSFLYFRRYAFWTTALVGAFLIQVAPSLTGLGQMYGAYPWYFSTFGVALTVFSTAALLEKPSYGRGCVVALGVFLTTVCHVLSSLMVLLCCGGAVIAVIATTSDRKASLRLLGSWGLSVVLGLGLSAFYLMPALILQQHVSPSKWFVPGFVDWHNSFLFPAFSARAFGTNWSAFQYYFPGVSIGIFFAGGAVAWLTKSRLGISATFFLFCGGLALVLGSELAYPLWEHIGPIQRLQRGYRFQVILAVTSVAFLVAMSARNMWWRGVTATGLVWCIALGVATTMTFLINIQVASKGLRISQAFSFEGRGPQQPQLLPSRGAREYATANQGPNWTDYLSRGGMEGYCIRERLECKVTRNQSHTFVVDESSPVKKRLVVPRFAFPFWHVHVDDHDVAQEYDTATGLISLELPPGAHSVQVVYQRTKAEAAGLVLSLISLILIGYLGVRERPGGAHPETRHLPLS